MTRYNMGYCLAVKAGKEGGYLKVKVIMVQLPLASYFGYSQKIACWLLAKKFLLFWLPSVGRSQNSYDIISSLLVGHR